MKSYFIKFHSPLVMGSVMSEEMMKMAEEYVYFLDDLAGIIIESPYTTIKSKASGQRYFGLSIVRVMTSISSFVMFAPTMILSGLSSDWFQ